MKNYNVIGSGFSGLSAAAKLAKAGKNVNIFEKNNKNDPFLKEYESGHSVACWLNQ